jgi:hypothetical protein
MFKNLFKREDSSSPIDAPTILGLRLGCSFELDALMLRLLDDQLITDNISPTQLIKAVGLVDLDGTWLYRFYTDDDAFLQIVADGKNDEDVVDIKLFHFYDTLNINNDEQWFRLLDKEIGQPTYELENHQFERVWTSVDQYHPPVAMQEQTYTQDSKSADLTDQFTMLFERPINDGYTESLFLSAEETLDNGHLSRCLVISTGITLSPAQFTIHG